MHYAAYACLATGLCGKKGAAAVIFLNFSLLVYAKMSYLCTPKTTNH